MNQLSVAQLRLFSDAFERISNRSMLFTGVDGTIVHSNIAAQEWLGYSADEILGRNIVEFHLASELEAYADQLSLDLCRPVSPDFEALVAKTALGDSDDKEWTYRRKDGSLFPVGVVVTAARDESGKISAYTLLARDITPQLEIIDALGASEERYRSVVDVMEEGIILQDADGAVRTCNSSAERMLELTLEQMNDPYLHSPSWDAISEDGSPFPPAKYPLTVTLRTGEPCSRVVMGLRKSNGSVSWLQINSQPLLRPGEDKMHAVMMSLTDITDIKRSESEIARACDAAITAAQLKSAFLTNASHEIRTPLNGIVGITDLLLHTELNEEQRDFTRTLQNSAESLLEIINDLLDLSKIEAGKFSMVNEDVDIRATVEDKLELMASRTQAKNLELTALIGDNVPLLLCGDALCGDAGRLRQVLVNLLSNALKFTERGEIIVRTILQSETPFDATLRFEVSDTGSGIAPDAQGRVFEPFWQAENSVNRGQASTGLGLAISRQLVELMGGNIWVDSMVGRGTTFHFTVRLRKSSLVRETIIQSPRPPIEIVGRRALIVDDNATNRKLLAHLLKVWKMFHDQAESGVEALGKIREAARNGTPYDVVLLDQVMPGMDGLTLARLVKAEPALAHTKMVMLTSLFGAPTRCTNDVQICLTKPVRQTRLLAALQRVLAEHDDQIAESVANDSPVVAPAPQPAPVQEDENPASKLQILLVEDNPVNQQVALHFLRAIGCKADTAQDGFKALEALDAKTYDVILMDCQMPGMDGYQATAEIRRREAETGDKEHNYIVALTAYAMATDRQKCLDAGMDDYLSKPFRLEDLKAAIERRPRKKQPGAEEGATEPAVPPPAPRPQELPVIDATKINELKSSRAGSQLLVELIDLFLNDAPPRLEAMEAAIEAQDAAAVARLAHTLGGSCSNTHGECLCANGSERTDFGFSGASSAIEATQSRIPFGAASVVRATV